MSSLNEQEPNGTEIDLLIEEKKLIHTEKLELIRTNKQSMGILLPLIGLALTQSQNTPEIFIILPFVVVAFLLFILATFNTLNIVYGYLEAIEREIASKSNSKFPLFQMSVGRWMADWKLNITKGDGFIFNPNYLMGFSFAIVILIAYIYCVYNGYRYLVGVEHTRSALGFLALTSAMMLFVLMTAATYAIRFRKVKEYAKSKVLHI